jgi:DNA topoisomerase-1
MTSRVLSGKTEKYTLIITEKPDAARRIASALDSHEKAEMVEERGVPYFVARRNGEIVVVPALGHLYTVAGERTERNYYPVFSFKWVPRYEVEKKAKRVRQWIQTITELAKDADSFVDACDYDIEGSIIGYCVLKYACDNKEQMSKRMKYSTLTVEELKKSYNELLPHLDFALIEAGCTRHEVDWLYGINLSRALTLAVKNSSAGYATLSTGRVQGPALKFVVKREKAIRSFVPTPYWEIKAQVEIDGQVLYAEYQKRTVDTKKEANAILDACKGNNGQIEQADLKQFQQSPPLPFDLGGLQKEAYDIFGYTPKRTSSIAQRLYLGALISYPRTSSQRLPRSIGYEAILKGLSRTSQYSKHAKELLAKHELRPHEGKRDDPAHPAIYPTGKLPDRTLMSSEAKVWDLIIRRFMAVFGEPAVRQSIKAQISINGYLFIIRGKRTLKEGWLHFYRPCARSEENFLPPMKNGQTVAVKIVSVLSKFTSPPPRYNPSSLLRKMEKTEIGTKATRADIIQTLYDRKYVLDESMRATDLGLEVLEVLESNCPTVVSTKLTKELEERMNRIRLSVERRENVLAQTVQVLKPALDELKRKEKLVGEKLSRAIRKARLEKRTVGPCPNCKTGKLVILRSRKTSKRFIGCTNYFKGLCKTSSPLPQSGSVRPLKRNCSGCSWPVVQIRAKGRRAWNLCTNPKCPLKERGGHAD